MDEKLLDKIKEIARFYGWEEQHRIAIEELSELIKAICKRERRFDGSFSTVSSESEERTAIVEELADVIIMAIQLTYLLEGEFDVKEVMEHKVERQLRRIDKISKDIEEMEMVLC